MSSAQPGGGLVPTHAPTGEPYPEAFSRERFVFSPSGSVPGRFLIGEPGDPAELAVERIRSRTGDAIAWATAVVVLGIGTLIAWAAFATGGMGVAHRAIESAIIFLIGAACAALARAILTPPSGVSLARAEGGGIFATLELANPWPTPIRPILVRDAQGRTLATIEVSLMTDWLLRRWVVRGRTEEDSVSFLAVEHPVTVAALRAATFGILLGKSPTDLVFRTGGGGLEWGRLSVRDGAFGRPCLQLSVDEQGRIDRRVAVALAAAFLVG